MRKWGKISMFLLGMSVLLSQSCLKEADLPLLKTTEVSNIKTESALSGGTIIDDGGTRLDVTGICWATEDNPTVAGSVSVSLKEDETKYDCLLFGLTQNTYYHVRSFAKNRVGTAYGNEVHFRTLPSVAKVTTDTVIQIWFTRAFIEGQTECDEEFIVREKGFCWAAWENPTIENTHKSFGYGSGKYIGTIWPIQPGTIYHVRAYAITGSGITYGRDISFRTLDTPSVTTTVKEFTRTSAIIEGKIISWEKYPVYVKRMVDYWGFLYGIKPDLMIEGNYYGIWECWDNCGVMPMLDGNGAFTVPFCNLAPGTTYYVKAYVYFDDEYYGNEVSFTTIN